LVSLFLAGRPDAILRAQLRKAEASLAPILETMTTPASGRRGGAQSPTGRSPAVSVILPTFNRARFVPDAIASVTGQTCADWELIIVDDGSDDDSAAAIRPFLADPRIRYLRQAHTGVCAARNLGLREARADIITFLDSDNLYFPGFLAGALAALRDDPGLSVAYGLLASAHHGLGETELLLRPFNRADLELGNFIDTNALICRKSVVEDVGGFDEGLDLLEGWDLVLRLTAYAPARPLPVLAAYYRVVDLIRLTDITPAAPALARIRSKWPASDIGAAGSGSLRRILVSGYGEPQADVSPHGQAALAIVERLRRLGCEVTFLPVDMRSSTRRDAALQALGVKVVTHDSGYGGAAEYLEHNAHQFGVFYLIGVDTAAAVVAAVRRAAPSARIILHEPDRCFARDGRAAVDPADETPYDAEAPRDPQITVMGQLDHVVVSSAQDLERLRSLLPNVALSLFAGLHAPMASLLRVLNNARALHIPTYRQYCEDVLASPSPIDGEVDVSIIVPVYNKWHLTRTCLNSVFLTSAGAGIRYETIVADDASWDDTVRAAEIFPGIHVERNSDNLGFLRNCNHAARAARGRYLLFLNNDTIVLPGWLEGLYRPMESDPTIAIAGSKLLYPDLKIQEAGGALFQDGSARNMGRGEDRDSEVFNRSREVDYISGASILVRADFWTAAGGFDERFKIAYCEDSDLAMTARALGSIVSYQPQSEVIHLEHQSYKDQLGASPKDLQAHNNALLFEKWKAVLSQYHSPADPRPAPNALPDAAKPRNPVVHSTLGDLEAAEHDVGRCE
jgi:GT2 family glycosyltransferase